MTLGLAYALLGGLFLAAAWQTRRGPRRRKGLEALFWAICGLVFIGGGALPDAASGVLVVVLAVTAAALPRGNDAERLTAPNAATAGAAMGTLFAPLLCVPVAVAALTLAGPSVILGGRHLVDPEHAGQTAYMLAALIGLGAACVPLRPRPTAPLGDGARILRQIGWAAMVPQMLAALGGVYAASGVNAALADLLRAGGVAGHLAPAVGVYALGMTMLTMLIGNAFAAFPVMFGACGLPLLVGQYGVPPAAVAAIGMLCGYCGTLLTPMAVNFNIVPTYLLGLPRRDAVLRAQRGTALALFAGNALLLYVIARLEGRSP